MRLSVIHLALVVGVGAAVIGLTHVQRPAEPAPVARLSGAELCRRDITKVVQFKDPASVQVGAAHRGKDQAGGISYYQVMVNAKNGFGGYTGEQAFDCFVSEAEQRVTAAAPIAR